MRVLKSDKKRKTSVRIPPPLPEIEEICTCTSCRLTRIEEQIVYLTGLIQGLESRIK